MDAYRIGVSIVMANGVSPVLAVIGRDLMGLHTNVNAIQSNFQGWSAALIGVGAILTGASIMGALTKIVEKTAEFQDSLTKISQLNPKVAELVKSGEIQKQAFGVGTNLGMKVEDVTKIYGGIYGAIQDPKESEEILPYAAAYARLMQARHPGSHPEESIRTLVKAGELSGRLYDDKGQIDPAKVKEWFDMAAIAEAATHGQVNAQALYGMAQQAGPGSLRGLSKEGYEHMMILSQEMGGQRAGTALLSLRQQMTGTMMKRSAEAMQHYGILNDGEWTSEGGHVSMTDAAKDRLLGALKQDPVKFVDDLVEQLEKRGITDKDKQMEAVTEMIGRQTSQRFVQDIIAQRQQIERETRGLDQGATVEQGLAGYGKNINANMQNLQSAWHNLIVAIGGPEGERFGQFLGTLASVVNRVTAEVNKLKPETIDLIFKLVTGFAAGLVVLGGIVTVALVSTLVSAPVAIAGAIAAVAAAVGTFIALEWTKIKAIFDGITSAISGFIDQIVALYDKVKGFFIPRQGDAPQFNKDLDDANKMYTPMRFDPSNGGGGAKHITLSLNVDGRTLAQVVSEQLSELTEFPSMAPAADGVSRWHAGDHNYGDTV